MSRPRLPGPVVINLATLWTLSVTDPARYDAEVDEVARRELAALRRAVQSPTGRSPRAPVPPWWHTIRDPRPRAAGMRP